MVNMTLLFLIYADNNDKLQLVANNVFMIIPFGVLKIAFLLTEPN